MTERKFTDEEVIMALELCYAQKGTSDTCAKCPYHKFGTLCKVERDRDALDLINRQRAEIADLTDENKGLKETNEHLSGEYIASQKIIKNLKGDIEVYQEAYKNVKAEAIKEFAERLKKRERSNAVCAWCAHADIYGRRAKECDEPYIDKNGKEHKACFAYAKFESYIDNLVKEMTEGKPCTEGADCSTCEHCYPDGGYNECAVDGIKPIGSEIK